MKKSRIDRVEYSTTLLLKCTKAQNISTIPSLPSYWTEPIRDYYVPSQVQLDPSSTKLSILNKARNIIKKERLLELMVLNMSWQEISVAIRVCPQHNTILTEGVFSWSTDAICVRKAWRVSVIYVYVVQWLLTYGVCSFVFLVWTVSCHNTWERHA